MTVAEGIRTQRKRWLTRLDDLVAQGAAVGVKSIRIKLEFAEPYPAGVDLRSMKRLLGKVARQTKVGRDLEPGSGPK